MNVVAYRPLVVWAGVTLCTALVVRWALAGFLLTGSFDVVLTGVAGLVLAGCAAWAWLVTTAVVVQAARGRTGAVRGVPVWAARAVLAACGVVVLAAAPGQASDDATDPPASGRGVLTGLPYPDRPTGPAHPPAHPPAGRAGLVVVRHGDSLWSIAASRLGPGADAAAVAAASDRLYALNRGTIGPDPDLLRPGQRLIAEVVDGAAR